MEEQTCSYKRRDGSLCQLPCHANGLCFWHDPDADKSASEVAPTLESIAHAGHSMEGFQLRKANLAHIDLVNRGNKKGYDLSCADLYRANLDHAHLFGIQFNNASLMKADLRHANLHCANLTAANLLGVKLASARLENIEWGEVLLQEADAKRSSGQQRLDCLQQCEEVCRSIRLETEHQGLFETAGEYFRKEMIMRRKQMPRLSWPRFLSKLVDLFCGYGERPLRTISFSLGVILFCSILYYLIGIDDNGSLLHLNVNAGFKDNIMAFLECLYFSVITFTTLGYGDLVPVGYSRIVSATEAFTGAFTIALFVVVFVKKMTR
jgi:hypothetical protein